MDLISSSNFVFEPDLVAAYLNVGDSQFCSRIIHKFHHNKGEISYATNKVHSGILLVRAECVRCPWLLAETKVATILGIFLVRAKCVRPAEQLRWPLF